ncbi:MAG: pitrilysin family protein [Candidatus Latescibacterota bacterium]
MIERTVYENGLKALTKTSKANDIVAVGVLLRMGTRYETDEQAGLSDLTQHLLLKGTESRTAEELAVEMDSEGIRLSASSGPDFGAVALLTTSEHLGKGLELLFDVLKKASFAQDKVAQEKEMVVRRIRARNDHLLSRAMDLLEETHFQSHPYHKPILGYPETVARFDRGQILDFHRAHFVPNNLLFSAVGNFDKQTLLEQIGAEWGELPSCPLPPSPEPALPVHDAPEETFEERDNQAAWIAIGYDAPTLGSPDYAAMVVLDAILGGAMGSRLFTELREKRSLAYQVGSHYAAHPEASLYAMYIGTSEERFAEARDGVLDEVRKLCADRVSAEELETAKTYLKGTFVMGQERNAAQAALMAAYEFLGLGYGFLEEYPRQIEGVTREDVLRVAQTYFAGPHTLGAVRPRTGTAEEIVRNGVGEGT